MLLARPLNVLDEERDITVGWQQGDELIRW
jgi:hypothetical protein